jgi:AcrR family transcriptional regulator
VVTAAAKLFATRGYVATSVDAVAYEAAVSRATVFNAVGGKAELLRAAYRSAVRGEHPDTPLGEQSRSRRILEDSDPARLLESYADVCAGFAPRLAPLYDAVRAAASADAEAARLWEELQRERRFGASRVVEALARLDALRCELDPSAASDILWVFNDPGLYSQLVQRRGWPDSRFRNWLATTMQTQLLQAPACA